MHDGQSVEIAIVGDLTDNEVEITNRLLDVESGGRCTLYFDTPGGSSYTALSLMSLIRLRDLNATGIVTGECSSAALWPFAACQRRFVTPYSMLLFHPIKWQSEENVRRAEASEWARHFTQLEEEMDQVLATLFGVKLERIEKWTTPHRYVNGKELVDAGIAELVDPLATFKTDGQSRPRRRNGARAKRKQRVG